MFWTHIHTFIHTHAHELNFLGEEPQHWSWSGMERRVVASERGEERRRGKGWYPPLWNSITLPSDVESARGRTSLLHTTGPLFVLFPLAATDKAPNPAAVTALLLRPRSWRWLPGNATFLTDNALHGDSSCAPAELHRAIPVPITTSIAWLTIANNYYAKRNTQTQLISSDENSTRLIPNIHNARCAQVTDDSHCGNDYSNLMMIWAQRERGEGGEGGKKTESPRSGRSRRGAGERPWRLSPIVC